jgi:hypothetical protein
LIYISICEKKYLDFIFKLILYYLVMVQLDDQSPIVQKNIPSYFTFATTHLEFYNWLIKQNIIIFYYNCNYKFMLMTVVVKDIVVPHGIIVLWL